MQSEKKLFLQYISKNLNIDQTKIADIFSNFEKEKKLQISIGKPNDITTIQLWLKDHGLDYSRKPLKCIENLDLSEKNITCIPKEIGILSTLTDLDLRGNKISKLPLEIVNLTKLETIDLSENNFVEIPEEVFEMSNLFRLTINDNQITEIPKEIKKLKKLEEVYFHKNKITDMTNICLVKKIRIIYLDYNEIKNIPDEINNLKYLNSIDVSNNKIENFDIKLNLPNLSIYNFGNGQNSTFDQDMDY